MTNVRLCSGVLLALLLCGCAHTPPDVPSDPLEPFNRKVYAFNETLDEWVAQPVARGYVRFLPQFMRTGINNFFVNVSYPTVIVNDLLQGKFAQGARDSGRFLFNTTVGLGGLVDAASLVGMDINDEDFGQTLGYWGVGQGWFLMLPVLGPTTNRDGLGQVANGFTNPLSYTEDEYRYGLYALGAVNSRAALLGVEGVLEQQFDRYAFVRGAYLQRRLSLTHDGNPPRELLYGEDFFEPEDE
jgi:phospholipid-binding lipoprotein MlaA